MKNFFIVLYILISCETLFAQLNFSAHSGLSFKNDNPSLGIANSVQISYPLNKKWRLGFNLSLNNYYSEGLLSKRKEIYTEYYGISDYRYQNPLQSLYITGYWESGLAVFKTKPDKFFHARYGLELSRRIFKNSKHSLESGFGINFNRIDITKVINTFVPEYIGSIFGGTSKPILFLVFLHQSYYDLGMNYNLQYYYKLNSFIDIGANTDFTWLPKSKNVFLSSQISLRFSRK